MAHLIFRCPTAKRVITTGIEVEARMFEGLHKRRTMPCRFCGRKHEWEIVDHAPDVFALMSLKAEFFLGRAVEYDAQSVLANDPRTRELFGRVAAQWYQLAADHEDKADALRED